MLEVRACRTRGTCPVYQVGDQMVINGPRILVDRTDAICVYTLSTPLHCLVALDEGADPIKLGLSNNKKHAYMQCVDPCEPYTRGGTVIFECRRIEEESSK